MFGSALSICCPFPHYQTILSSTFAILSSWLFYHRKHNALGCACVYVCVKPGFVSVQDNFLRGDVSRRMYHQQQQQQRKPLRKPKPAALTKKHKKKGKRGPRRPQKPIPPALPQGNLGMPAALSVPSQSSSIR